MRFSLLIATVAAATLLATSCQQQLAVKTPTSASDTGNTNATTDPHPTTAMTNQSLPDPHMVEFDTAARPQWLEARIQKLLGGERLNPPIQIFRYRYRNQVVYFETAPCCDQFSTLYDSKGKVLCQPDGGLTGKGDSGCLDFAKKRSEEMLVWQDAR